MQCGLTDEIGIGQERGPGLVQSFLKSLSSDERPQVDSKESCPTNRLSQPYSG